ncbi:hypothetical protein ACHAXA_000872 [Cyclostephanos tholiformis]|uniref:Pentatricopeptide repeat-containing protein n=1 Tax=Cyclostephanos tholiformis TaxID=382380 RepID=A0ABD3R0F0_9STRA
MAISRSERDLAAWVDRCRRSGGEGGVAAGGDLDGGGGADVAALLVPPNARAFEDVISGLLSLPPYFVVDDDVGGGDGGDTSGPKWTRTDRSGRATRILDMMEAYHEPPGKLYDVVIASHCADVLDHLSSLSVSRISTSNDGGDRQRRLRWEGGGRRGGEERWREDGIEGDAIDADDEWDYHGRRRAAYRSARSALRILNRSEELYRETGMASNRLPSVSSYVAVMDAWKALAVDASTWSDAGKGKRKIDEAMEVMRNLRKRRMRVYDPHSNESGDDDGKEGGGGRDSRSDHDVEYSVLPPVEVVASMTVDEVLNFGVKVLRESVPAYRLRPRTSDDDGDDEYVDDAGEDPTTTRIGTWHFNRLIFDLAKYPQPLTGPLAQDLLDYMVSTMRAEDRWRRGEGTGEEERCGGAIDSTTRSANNKIVPKPNVETVNGVLRAWMVTPRSHHPDVARRAEAVLARLAAWQSEGILWNVTANTVSYNTCINIWKECSADVPGAAQRATDILLLMEEESSSASVTTGGVVVVAPDVVSYATCMGAWAERSFLDPDAGKNAEEILMRMYNRNKVSDLAPRPTTRCFNAVLLAYANSNGGQRSGGGKRALELLRFMERLNSEGYADLSPDIFTFNIVMKALANCGERGAARKANLLLQRMEDSHARGNTGLKPDLLSYNTVLDAFSKEGDAKSAERLLEQMLDNDDGVIKPDSHSYTSVLMAWSRNEDKSMAVSRAEDLFNDIEKRYASGESYFRADTGVYNALIKCWAKSGERKALYRVNQILSLMEELGFQGGDSTVQPNSRTYCAVLDTLAKSKNYKAHSKSLEILERMHELYSKGYNSVRPCVRAYSIVLSTIARSRRQSKALEAQELLHKMEAEYRGGNSACRPNVYSYNAVLNAAAFSGRDEGEMEDAFRVACLTFDELRMSAYLEPSDVSYGTFIKAIKQLMPESDVRDNLVKGLFRKCCRDGLVSNFVLKEMADLATPDLYQSLLKGVTSDYGNFPKSWSAKVREQSNALQI